MTSSYEIFTGAKNTATGNPYNWHDQRASTWYEGYGPGGGYGHGNAGSFVDLSTLTAGTADYNQALDAITNNIIGLFEQKGITADQASTQTVTVNGQAMTYDDLLNQAKSGDTKGAFQNAAAAVTSAADRGDLWGADTSEGGMAERGKSFLESGVSDTTTISDLYTQGFGRAGDAQGIAYWQSQLDGGLSIQDIAASFAASDEAQLRTAYHEQYGRDADQSGLDYWLSQDESATGTSDVANFLNAVTYRGEDQDGDGIVSAEERLTSTYSVQSETMVRDDLRNIMGQVSGQDDRANNPFFTDANNADVQRYMDHIAASGGDAIDPTTGERIAGVGNQGDSYDNALFTNTHIGYRGLTQDALNQGDADDFGDNATRMGRFGTVAEQKAYMDAHSGVDSDNLSDAQATNRFSRDLNYTDQYGQGVFDSVHPKTWGAVTQEDPDKTYTTWDDPFGGRLSKKEAEGLLSEKNQDYWFGKMTIPQNDSDGTSPDGWRPTPTKPRLPTPLPVDRKDINYMPNVSSDVQDTSGYGQAKTQFDQTVAGTPIARTAQGQAGQRFTGTSAKGVRMKKSKASRMGTIRGTKQLGREQQTQSLNI